MAQTNYTPIQLYYSTTAAAVPTSGNLVNGELAINITDGKLYYKNNSGVVTLLASTSGASGDVVGPASATDTAVALFDGTTGKLIKNSPVTIGSTGNTVISGTDNTNAMLRITQLGTGNALLVEDSTNPDATPFVIDASGNVYSGYATAFNYLSIGGGTLNPRISVAGTTGDLGSIGAAVFANATTAPTFVGAKSRNTTVGSHTVVADGDSLLNILAEGSDGTAFIRAASIVAQVDGTPGTNDMPGRLVFSTTADGASSPTERMRIDSIGNVGIATASVAGYRLILGGVSTPSPSGNAYGVANSVSIQSDVTATYRSFRSSINTQATAFTLSNLYHFDAGSATIGAGSSLTNQVGFYAQALTGATNNYGFYGSLASAANTYNLYMSGTANNYLAGNLSIGTTTSTSMLQVAGSSSVSAIKTPNIAEVDTITATAATGTINFDITTQSVLFYTSNATANWTLNFRGSSGTTLNTLMQTGECISATFLVTQGATAYYNSAVTIDGTSVTPKWQGGTAPTSGNASSVDCYTYVIQKVGSASYTVLASQTKFA